MTAAEVRAACARLEAASKRLAEMRGAERLAALGRVLDAWSEPGSPIRRRLLDAHPRASGLARETVAAGLDLALAGWNADALAELVTRELGSLAALDAAVAPGVTTVIHGGVIPMPTLVDALAPLLLGSAVLSKPAARDPVTPRLLAESLDELAPELAGGLEVADVRRDDDAGLAPMLAAARVVVTGGDDAVAAIRARCAAGTRLVAHGHGLSLAILGDDPALDLHAAAEALAVDVALWDQLGCLSPVACLVLGDALRADAFADALAAALAAREAAWPRGEVEPAAAAAFAHERADAELRAAAGGGVRLHGAADGAWAVVREADATPRPAPLHRFVRVQPVAGWDAVAAATEPLRPHLAGLALAGFRRGGEARERASGLGASRVAPFGALQAPPLHWARDGLGPLRSLLPDEAMLTPGRGRPGEPR